MLDEDEVDATAPETPEASAGGAAPAGEPAAPAEPAVAAAPETPATAPIPGVDDYDWGKYDPSAKGYLEGFHEDLRPWAEKFHGHYASQLEEQRTLARYHQE